MNTLEKKANYKILREGLYSDYVIINRQTSYKPYVVCYAFDKEDYTWAQGHYHDTMDEALIDFYGREMNGLQNNIEAILENGDLAE